MVGVYAYREYGDPPSFKLEPNVYVQITPALFLAPGRTRDVYEEWGEKASSVGRYDYYQVYQWNLDNLPGANVAPECQQEATQLFR